jgi:hypothetical protein
MLNIHTSALKMEAADSSETPVSTDKTTRCHIPQEHSIMHEKITNAYILK